MDMHNLRYKKLTGDGDSSVLKILRNVRPYGPTYFIEKTECRDHLLRNFCNKIRELAKTPRTDINLRNYLRNNVLKFRTAIVSAVKYRKSQNIPFADKVQYPKKDILNGPAHIFGDYINCDSYFCDKHGQHNPIKHTELLNSTLYDLFSRALNRVANNADSLLHDMDTNSAECYNASVNKFLGGKRVNFSLRGFYQGRCLAAAVNFNTKGLYVAQLISSSKGKIGIYTQKFANKKLKLSSKKYIKKKSKKIRKQSADSNYGLSDTEDRSVMSMRDLSRAEHESRIIFVRIK